MKSEKGKMRFIGRGILYGLGALAFAAVFALLFGWVLMLLWNWLMPAIFGLTAISYMQAWGLILLSHLLFRGSGHGGRHPDFSRSGRSRSDHFHRHDGFHPSREDMDSFKREFRTRMKRHWEDDVCPGGCRSGEEEEQDRTHAADSES